MDINNLVNAIFGHEPKEQIKNEDDFVQYMEKALKEIFGEDVKFEKVKEVDDGKNYIHIEFKEKEEDPVDKYMPKKEWNDDELDIMSVVKEDEMEGVKHLVRKIAQQHKHELPLAGIYNAVAAHLANESDKLLRNKEKARQKAQKASMLKSKVCSKFNDFTQGLSDEERDTLNEMLKEI